MHQSKNKKFNIYFYFLVLILLSTIFNLNLFNFFKQNFKIKNINQNLSSIEIFELKSLIDKNIYSLKKENLKKIINNYNIIKHFEIKKIYPDTLEVKIVKTKPIALLKNENKFIYLGDNEKVFESFERFYNIPKITGSFGNQNIIDIFKILKKSNFKIIKVKEIKVYPSNRFDLILHNENIIKFPIDVHFKTIELAKKILEENDLNKSIIDLRLSDKVILSNE